MGNIFFVVCHTTERAQLQ
jgi:hypothetical protein